MELTRTWRVEAGFDLGRTLAPLGVGRGDPTYRNEAGAVWWATRNRDGAASVRFERSGADVVAAGWGPGAGAVLDRLPEFLGAADRPGDFAPPPGLVADLHRRHRGLRFCATHAVFQALLPTIIEQKVTGKEARRSYIRLVRRHGEPAPGPGGLTLQPPPGLLAALPYEDYHPLGIERKRADTIRRAAHRASRLEEIVAMGREEARARLMAFPGIGPWSAAIVMQETLGDCDAVIVGDYHLPNVVAWNLAGEPRADDARMLELLEPFAGHRARASRLIGMGGRKPPRYGPRVALRSIERI